MYSFYGRRFLNGYKRKRGNKKWMKKEMSFFFVTNLPNKCCRWKSVLFYVKNMNMYLFSVHFLTFLCLLKQMRYSWRSELSCEYTQHYLKLIFVLENLLNWTPWSVDDLNFEVNRGRIETPSLRKGTKKPKKVKDAKKDTQRCCLKSIWKFQTIPCLH